MTAKRSIIEFAAPSAGGSSAPLMYTDLGVFSTFWEYDYAMV